MRRPLSCLIISALLLTPSPAMANESFISYTNPTYLPFTFEYPADWQPEPSTGTTESYSQVQLYAPRLPDDRLRTYLVVRMTLRKPQGGKYETLEEMVRTFRSTLMSDMVIDGERRTEVLGTTAVVLDISGGLHLPWKSPQATLVPIKGQRIFFERDGRLYELAWLTSVDRAPEIEQIFSHLLSTLAPFAE